MCKLHNATVYLTLDWRLCIFLSFLIELFLMNKNIIEVQQNDDMIFTYQIKLSRTVKEGDKNQKKNTHKNHIFHKYHFHKSADSIQNGKSIKKCMIKTINIKPYTACRY